MPVEMLRVGDGRCRGLRSDWDVWLRQADALYGRFLTQVGVSPFFFHEVACSAFLASAAAMAGFTPLAEYAVVKRGRYDRRFKVDGRADLWFSSRGRSYSFELKRALAAATPNNLAASLGAAKRDIGRIPRDEYHYAAGLLVARIRDEHREAAYLTFAEHVDVDLAVRIGPKTNQGAYLFFQFAR